MKILIACEESQIVTEQFLLKGHEVMSCDVEYEGAKGLPHYKGDVLDIINNGWDMMIAFPPCTHIAVSGAAWFEQKRKDGRQKQGIEFFMKMINAPIEKIAVENPVGIMSSVYRKPDQIIHPYYFGDEFSKPTCLWLKNLLLLFHAKETDLFNNKTHVGKGEFITSKSGRRGAKWNWWLPPGKERAKIRSKTFPKIAKAMANQWG